MVLIKTYIEKTIFNRNKSIKYSYFQKFKRFVK